MVAKSKTGDDANAAETGEQAPEETTDQSAVEWDDAQMATNFANVVNVQCTREQVDVFFGTNKTWNVPNERKVTVGLSNRVILTPFAAKRLWTILGSVLKEYESRHGPLKL